MAGKSLYGILEVAPNATPEMLSAAYRVQCERLDARAKKDPDTARVLRLAVDEAYHTLSDPHARGRYDLKLRQQTVFVSPVPEALLDDRSWFARNWAWMFLLVAIVGGGGYYYDKNKKERAAAERALVEQKAALEKERADRAAEDAARAAAVAEAESKRQREREIVWSEQVRAQARGDYQRRVQAEQRDRQMEERREEAERLRQENEARRNLEREKIKLRQLQCGSGPC
jgi:hypothetical protein